MKKKTQVHIASMMLMALLFAQPAAYAQALVEDGALYAQAGIDIGADIDAEVYSTTTVDSEVSETTTSTDGDMFFQVNASGLAVIAASQVEAESDLEVFAENATVKNPKVARVDIDTRGDEEMSVKVTYKHSGKFLGFLPVTVRSTTIVESNAESEPKVSSRLSWWSFLVAEKDYEKAELESRIQSNPMIRANATAHASAAAKARVAEAVIAEMNAYTSAQVAAQVN
jgi:hypothetical protein